MARAERTSARGMAIASHTGMPRPSITPRLDEQLQEIARNYRHVRAEREREGLLGSWRRRQLARMARLQEQFESVLSRSGMDEQARERWRRHLHHGAPPPTV